MFVPNSSKFCSVYLYENDPDEHDECVGGLLPRTAGFAVFKLNEDVLDWEKVESIGDYALFLGIESGPPVFVSPDDYPGCRVNCIYFTDDGSEFHKDDCHGGYDIGVYDIGEDCLETFSCRGLYDPILIWPPPVWVFPCM
ncbi:unnamed protein product [Linum trigynum]|uniref:KIB1-4 beta-propeller domain-containing protein n=1 Tax=Linum trigynum TaxID=586398 RepID=A0AAV2D3W1_9ROSI